MYKFNLNKGSISEKAMGRPQKIELTIHKIYGYAFGPKNPNWTTFVEHNETFLRTVVDFLTQLYQSKGYLFLNEALDAFGLEPCGAGQVTGWHREDGFLSIEFGKVDFNDAPDEYTWWIEFEPHGVIVNRIDPS